MKLLGVRYYDAHLASGEIDSLKRNRLPKITNRILGKAASESKYCQEQNFVQDPSPHVAVHSCTQDEATTFDS